MSKATLEQATELLERLTLDEKLDLVKRLEHETAKIRLNRLWADIDRRRKGRRFTMTEIQREIDAVRREQQQRQQDVSHPRRHRS